MSRRADVSGVAASPGAARSADHRRERRPTVPCGIHRIREEQGTMTVLTLGVLVVILMVIGVGVAITGVHLERNELQSMADGAALAASQGFDEPAVYESEAAVDESGAAVAENPADAPAPRVTTSDARRVAQDYLARYPDLHARLRDVAIQDVTVEEDGTVHVTLVARCDPPLAGWFTRGTGTAITLHATGDGRAR